MVDALSTSEILTEKQEMLLTAIKNKKEIGKRDAIDASGLQDDEWMPTIKALLKKLGFRLAWANTDLSPTIEAM